MEIVKKAINEFHARFYPEVRVEFVGKGKDNVALLFTGHFCLTCGLHDYFEDFREVLSKLVNREVFIEDKLPLNHGYTGWIVIYTLKKLEKEKQKVTFLIKSEKGELEEFSIEVD
ncbi:MAG: hypothetical protein ACTSX9_02970 [Candidatus Njordarchaeales archaeon]